jgi:hypothetical protein
MPLLRHQLARFSARRLYYGHPIELTPRQPLYGAKSGLSVALSPLDGTTMGASLDVSGLPRLARPLRVLLVEDDASIREGLNKLVNTLGHRAHITQNVREALDLAVSEN